MAKPTPGSGAPTEREIAARAYTLWEVEGRPQGRAAVHWEQARRELVTRSEPAWSARRHGLGRPRSVNVDALPSAADPQLLNALRRLRNLPSLRETALW